MSASGDLKKASALAPADEAEDLDEESGGAALTRQAIVRIASESLTHLSRREIKRLVDSVLEEMTEALIAGETVKLHDFGSFVVRDRGERSGRNPRTGARVPIEPRRVVVFKASPHVKQLINGAEGAPDPDATKD
ncbi:MAG TPA: integration host factor subunit alpha [Methylocystis sp.]|nr:integration host factor subunit alpha [Methylocystis sp.]